MRIKVCAAIFLILFLLPFSSRAGSRITLTPEDQFQFAEHYFEKGDYYRAVGEFKRYIYFFPGAGKIELARYKIALSYLKGERYKQAIQAFNRVIEKYRDTKYSLESYLGISRAYLGLKNYDMAIKALKDLMTICGDEEMLDRCYYQKAWVYMEMGMWDKAVDSFEGVSSRNREGFQIGRILKEVSRQTPLKKKDPTLAGALAIIPGAGHLYCGRKRDALVSFLLNGAMIYAAFEAFDEDMGALGGIITFVELGLYSGNIYSAVSSAHKYNRNQRENFLNYLKENTRFKFSLAEDKEVVLFTLGFSY